MVRNTFQYDLAQLTLDMHLVENCAVDTESGLWSCIGGRVSLKYSKT